MLSSQGNIDLQIEHAKNIGSDKVTNLEMNFLTFKEEIKDGRTVGIRAQHV